MTAFYARVTTTTTTVPITDANSVNTSDWRCIRKWEGGGRYDNFSGAYGFADGNNHSQMSPSAQDAWALRLFAQNHYHFSGTWNDPCTISGGGYLR